jgi:DNA recombination-dependent growth factor C
MYVLPFSKYKEKWMLPFLSQRKKELEAQAESIEKRFKPLEKTDEPDLKDEDVKEILPNSLAIAVISDI